MKKFTFKSLLLLGGLVFAAFNANAEEVKFQKADPENYSVVEKLSDVVLWYDQDIFMYAPDEANGDWDPTFAEQHSPVYNKLMQIVAYTHFAWPTTVQDYNAVAVYFVEDDGVTRKEITEPGTYTFTINPGQLRFDLDGDWEADADVLAESVMLTYIIEGGDEPTPVDFKIIDSNPYNGTQLESLSSFNIIINEEAQLDTEKIKVLDSEGNKVADVEVDMSFWGMAGEWKLLVNPEITKNGVYTIEFEVGALTDYELSKNEEKLTLTYRVKNNNQEDPDDPNDSVNGVAADGVSVVAVADAVVVNGLAAGDVVTVVAVDGSVVAVENAISGEVRVNLNKGMYVVRVNGNKGVKVVL